MNIKEIRRNNLNKLIEKYGSQRHLSEKIDIDSSYLSQIKNPDNPKNIGEKMARKIEVALRLPVGYMDLESIGADPTLSIIQLEAKKQYKMGAFDIWDSGTPLRDDEVALPFFREVELSAGSGSTMIQENNGFKLRFSRSTLSQNNVDVSMAACVTVSGNSMEPVLPDGATIGIDTSKTIIKDGDLYAIDHDGHLRVKMVYRMPTGIRLKSFNNEEWPDEHYNAQDSLNIKILGRVFWWSVLR